jgi:hypothetical protein
VGKQTEGKSSTLIPQSVSSLAQLWEVRTKIQKEGKNWVEREKEASTEKD